jgi:hypothetical protein
MKQSKECVRMARYCEYLADATNDHCARELLLIAAGHWRSLAIHVPWPSQSASEMVDGRSRAAAAQPNRQPRRIAETSKLLDTPNRSVEYRHRAGECRTKAQGMLPGQARESLLRTADTWERMAEWEDRNNPAGPPASNFK